MQPLKAPSLIVKCPRPDLHTDYARITLKPGKLEFLFLRASQVKGCSCQLSYGHSECLHFAAYPEAQKVFDGIGWNLDELRAWTDKLGCNVDAQEPLGGTVKV